MWLVEDIPPKLLEVSYIETYNIIHNSPVRDLLFSSRLMTCSLQKQETRLQNIWSQHAATRKFVLYHRLSSILNHSSFRNDSQTTPHNPRAWQNLVRGALHTLAAHWKRLLRHIFGLASRCLLRIGFSNEVRTFDIYFFFFKFILLMIILNMQQNPGESESSERKQRHACVY